MATLEELVIKISADTKGLQTQLTSVQNQLKKTDAAGTQLAQSFKKVGLTLGGIFAANRIFESFKKTIDYMDDMQDAADRVGISSESFSKLAYGAKQAEVDIGSLEMGLRKMLLAFAEANDPKSGAAGALNALGLKLSELKSLQPDVAFGKIADALNKVADVSSKTAIAQEIFGRGSAQLNDILKEGSVQIAEWARQAENAGLVVTPEMAQKAEDAKRAFTELGGAFSGLMVAFADTTAITNLTSLLRTLSAAIIDVSDYFKVARKEKEAFDGLVSRVPAGSQNALRQAADDIKLYSERVANYNERIRTSQRGGFQGLLENPKRLESLRDKAVSDLMAAQAKYGELTNLASPAASSSTSSSSGSSPARTNKAIFSPGGSSGGKSEREKELDKLKSKLESITESTKTDIQKAQGEIATLEEAHLKGLIKNEEEYKQIKVALNKELEEAIRKADTLENKILDIGDSAVQNIGSELVEAMRRGENAGKALWTSFKFNAIKAITDIAVEMAKKKLLEGVTSSGSSSAGGIFSNLLGGLFSSSSSSSAGGFTSGGGMLAFADGGYTGKGGGAGVDGKGGFPAILHPDEMVLNGQQWRGLGKGGKNSVNNNIIIQATNQNDIDRRLMSSLPLITDHVTQAVLNNMNSGGNMSRAIQRRI